MDHISSGSLDSLVIQSHPPRHLKQQELLRSCWKCDFSMSTPVRRARSVCHDYSLECEHCEAASSDAFFLGKIVSCSVPTESAIIPPTGFP